MPVSATAPAPTEQLVDSRQAHHLQSCAARDVAALGLLFDELGACAHALAVRVVREPRLAEEVVEEAFLAVWREAVEYRSERLRPSAWVLAIVHRQAVSVARRERRRPGADPVPARPRETRASNGSKPVRSPLELLRPVERSVVERAYYGARTDTETAAELGLSLVGVRRRAATGLRRLRAAHRSGERRLANPAEGAFPRRPPG